MYRIVQSPAQGMYCTIANTFVAMVRGLQLLWIQLGSRQRHVHGHIPLLPTISHTPFTRLVMEAYLCRYSEYHSRNVEEHRDQDDVPVQQEDHPRPAQLGLPKQVHLLGERNQVVEYEKSFAMLQRSSTLHAIKVTHSNLQHPCCWQCGCPAIASIRSLGTGRRSSIHATEHRNDSSRIQPCKRRHVEEAAAFVSAWEAKQC